MKDAAAALAAFLERLGRFFDIFDLSFIVSGATAVGAVAFLLDTLGLRMVPLSGWVHVAAIIVACYVAGLLCFAAGRWLRMGSRRAQAIGGFDAHFEAVLGACPRMSTSDMLVSLRHAIRASRWPRPRPAAEPLASKKLLLRRADPLPRAITTA